MATMGGGSARRQETATGKDSAAAEAGGVDVCRLTPSFALLCSLSPSLSESLPLSLGFHISATWRLTAENRRHISMKSPKPASGYKLTGL
jgi:hypothetical protein